MPCAPYTVITQYASSLGHPLNPPVLAPLVCLWLRMPHLSPPTLYRQYCALPTLGETVSLPSVYMVCIDSAGGMSPVKKDIK